VIVERATAARAERGKRRAAWAWRAHAALSRLALREQSLDAAGADEGGEEALRVAGVGVEAVGVPPSRGAAGGGAGEVVLCAVDVEGVAVLRLRGRFARWLEAVAAGLGADSGAGAAPPPPPPPPLPFAAPPIALLRVGRVALDVSTFPEGFTIGLLAVEVPPVRGLLLVLPATLLARPASLAEAGRSLCAAHRDALLRGGGGASPLAFATALIAPHVPAADSPLRSAKHLARVAAGLAATLAPLLLPAPVSAAASAYAAVRALSGMGRGGEDAPLAGAFERALKALARREGTGAGALAQKGAASDGGASCSWEVLREL